MRDGALNRTMDPTAASQRLGRAVAAFVGVAVGFSWLTWLPLVVAGPTTVMPWFFYLGSMGPAFGAIAAALVLRSDGGVGTWARRTFSLAGIGPALIVVVVSIVLYVGVGLVVEQGATGSIGSVSSVGLTSKIPGASAVLVALIWLVTFGLGEETGWRGWLMPALTDRFGFFAAALMVAGVWLVWHLPQFLFNTNFRAMGWAVIGWALALVAGSFWLGWLATLGRWSIVPVVVWHGGFDLLTSSDLGPSAFPATISTLVMVQAAVVTVVLPEHSRAHRTVVRLRLAVVRTWRPDQ
jgi:membrane protease YdiL (CAAX protease family)